MLVKEAVVAILYPKPNKKTKEKVFRLGEFGFPVKFIFIYLEHRTQGWLREGKAKTKRVVKNDSL